MQVASRSVAFCLAVIGAMTISPARAGLLESLLYSNGASDLWGTGTSNIQISNLALPSATGISSTSIIPDDFRNAYNGGFETGYSIGYDWGFAKGEERGTTAGTTAGDDDGYAAGWDATYSGAYDAAYAANYTPGVNAGYTTGLIDGFASGKSWAAEQDRLRSSSAGCALIMNSISSGTLTISGGGGPGGGGGGSSSGTLSISTFVDQEAHYRRLGWDDGNAAGRAAGDVAGYDAAYPIAYEAAYDAAFIVGGEEGFATGTTEGASSGYWAGYDVGYDKGLPIGFDNGVLAYEQSKQSKSNSGGVITIASQPSSTGVTTRIYVEPTLTFTPPVAASSQDSTQIPEPAAGILMLLAAAVFRRLRTCD